jgi:hypothetical protein
MALSVYRVDDPGGPTSRLTAAARGVLARMLAAVLVVIALIAFAQPASAVQIHQYSVGKTNFWAYEQTGVMTVRPDADISVPAGVCPPDPTQGGGPVAYQTQWVITNETATNWLEMGTLHRSGSCDYHFWGYGENDVWNPYGWEPVSVPSGPLYFQIYRVGGNWNFDIQGVDKWNLALGASTWAGIRVEVGLETWESTIVAPATDYTNLSLTRAEGPWIAWDSGYTFDSGPTSPMCGRWNPLPSAWRAGENTSC